MPSVFSYVYLQFFRMSDLWREKATTTATTKIKCKFLEVLLVMHNFLDMPKCFCNQLIIMHKQKLWVIYRKELA